MKTTSLTAETFDATLTSTDQPVLVDFWAEWCGPCKMLSPILDQIAAEQEGRAVIAKVDTEAYPDLAARFNVRAIPTMIVFKNGQPVTTITGVKSKGFIEAALNA
jgi:thioredoxin 1